MTSTNGDPDQKPTEQTSKPNMTEEEEAELAAFSGASNRLPPFHKMNPTLWFAHAEAVFYTSKVTSQVMKYQATMANLSMEVLEQVADLVEQTNTSTPYDDLKARLIQVYGESQTRRIQRLLQDTQLGNQKPSQLLRVMLQQAGTIVSKEMVRTLWLRNLPSRMQAILTATGQADLEKLAEIADKIAEIDSPNEAFAINHPPQVQPTPQPSPVASSAQSSIDLLVSEMRSLRAEVAEIRQAQKSLGDELQSRKNYRGRNRSRPPGRPRSRSSSRGGVCYYHQRFKDNAQKCLQPCSYKPKNP